MTSKKRIKATASAILRSKGDSKKASSRAVTQRASTTRRKPGRPTNADPQVTLKTAKASQAEDTKLPPCHGPKLHRFKHYNSRIEWLERLDYDRSDQTGVQGYVFRVKIETEQYALKVFKEFDPETIRWFWEAYTEPGTSAETAAYYTDPFYCECRAYGRIQDALDDGTLKTNPAVPCYGYMLLGPDDESMLEKKGIALRLDSSDDESQEEPVEPSAVRAIVKKFAGPASGVKVRQQGKIFRNIQLLNGLGIYNRDIRTENFREGLLVDFGSSLTEPDILLDNFDEDEAKETYLQDGGMFEDMLRTERITLKLDPVAASKSLKKLRPRGALGQQALT